MEGSPEFVTFHFFVIIFRFHTFLLLLFPSTDELDVRKTFKKPIKNMTLKEKQDRINSELQTMGALRYRMTNSLDVFNADTTDLEHFNKTEALIKDHRDALMLLDKHSQFYLDALKLEVDEG
jgi:hypothetical protein